MHNKDIDNIMLMLDSDDHENVWLGFQIMETLNLSREVISKYASLNKIQIEKQENLLKASGQVNQKIATLLSKLSLNMVAYCSEEVYNKVSKYTYSFLGMLVQSESKKYVKKESVNFYLKVYKTYVDIFTACIFKKCKEVEKRKTILEKIPSMKAYILDNVSCDMQLINNKEYSFEFKAQIQLI